MKSIEEIENHLDFLINQALELDDFNRAKWYHLVVYEYFKQEGHVMNKEALEDDFLIYYRKRVKLWREYNE